VVPSIDPGRPAASQQPVALLYGPGHRIVHGNPAFLAEFGAAALGLPAREALPALPSSTFRVIDRALASGRAVACWLEIAGERRRLVVAPRRDPEDGSVYGVAIRLARG
jgi:hypothetical protein